MRYSFRRRLNACNSCGSTPPFSLDTYPEAKELERLYIAAHALTGTAASYGFPLFAEVAGKLAHIFQYAMNASIAPDASAPLVEFISEAVSLLESDLIMVSTNMVEPEDDFVIFKQRYPFAFQAAARVRTSAGRCPRTAGRGDHVWRITFGNRDCCGNGSRSCFRNHRGCH